MNAPVQLPPFFRGAVSEVRAESLPYHLADQRMPKHWEHTGGGKGVVVGVCDTGIDAEHQVFAGRIRASKSFIPNESVDDSNDHGTHVASTIAGDGVGVAPGAELVIAKVLGNNGSGSNRGVAAGINYCVAEGCNIINLSLGGPHDDPETRSACIAAKEAGCLLVAATGNERASHVSYPARHCIGVGAVDRAMKLADFSNRGKHVDLVGYGVNLFAAIPGGRYAQFSGTSMATPFIAGLAALRLSAELKHQGRITTETTDDLLRLGTFVTDLGPGGRDTSYGRGFPLLDKALYEKLDAPAPAPPAPGDDPSAPQFGTIQIQLTDLASGQLFTPVAAMPIPLDDSE